VSPSTSSSTTRLHSRDGKTPPCRHSQLWRSLLREYTCMRSKRHWPLKIILYFIDFACVNAFVPWILKYPDWQQRKNHRRCLYLLSLGEDMVRPFTRRAERGNVNRHIYRAKRTMGVPCKQPAFPTTVRKDRRWHGRCYICQTAKHRKIHWKSCHCSEWVCKDHSIKTIQITCNNCKEQS